VIWSDKLPDAKRFELVLDDAGVLDKETGLIWERSPSATVLKKWNEATIYCYHKAIGNRKGWRLPTVEELLSLVDQTQSSPALPNGHPFNDVTTHGYWTATTVVNAPGQAWVVNIGSGNLDTDNKATEMFVWCVRGGQGLMYAST
jgi:hypothetical protein